MKTLVGSNGRMRTFRNVTLTAREVPVAMVVAVQDKGMKAAWYLPCSRSDLTGSQVKRIYGKRFTWEERFRDVKDMRYGLGMNWKKVTKTDRRDRFMFFAVIALHLWTLLGAAGEKAGLDRLLKTNTSAKRQWSLVRQGRRWYALIPGMDTKRLKKLVAAYKEVLKDDPISMALSELWNLRGWLRSATYVDGRLWGTRTNYYCGISHCITPMPPNASELARGAAPC